eukprot:gnl/Chilomastix_cuspidata/4657.p1 GENE.gnl/Chilomastix_cuspidata/4657~~gnl/Chilomastix_cuspidata/4657.p1  ORF type:complete len:435 (+),score=198.30 gnl/Chilomastix_cuspidata/4657:75-1307(+)
MDRTIEDIVSVIIGKRYECSLPVHGPTPSIAAWAQVFYDVQQHTSFPSFSSSYSHSDQPGFYILELFAAFGLKLPAGVQHSLRTNDAALPLGALRSYATTALAALRRRLCPRSLAVSLLQVQKKASREETFAHVRALVRTTVAAAAPDVLVLPEMWSCPYDTAQFAAYAEELGAGPVCRFLSALSRDVATAIIGGTLPERDGAAVFNTLVVFDAEGRLVAFHRKLHLFDVDIPDGIRFRESDSLAPGGCISAVRLRVGAGAVTLGLGVCFDIRFVEQALALGRVSDALVFPAAFNTTTGPLHWALLGRSRAVDTQRHVLLCSPARGGGWDETYETWGFSMVVDPWGKVLAEGDERPAVLSARIDLSENERIFHAIPLAQARAGKRAVYHLAARVRVFLGGDVDNAIDIHA